MNMQQTNMGDPSAPADDTANEAKRMEVDDLTKSVAGGLGHGEKSRKDDRTSSRYRTCNKCVTYNNSYNDCTVTEPNDKRWNRPA